MLRRIELFRQARRRRRLARAAGWNHDFWSWVVVAVVVAAVWWEVTSGRQAVFLGGSWGGVVGTKSQRGERAWGISWAVGVEP